MLENYRLKVMKRMHLRYQVATKWKGKLVPHVVKRLNDNWAEARKFEVFGAGQGEFQCKVGTILHVVNLNNWTCDCGRWVVSGVPCMHAMACIRTNNEEIEDYVHSSFFVTTYFKVYNNIIHPQPDLGVIPMPTDNIMQPPPFKRRPGRPKKARKIGPAEKLAKQRSTVVHCSACKEIGHNIRRCKRTPIGSKQRTGSSCGAGASSGAATSSQHTANESQPTTGVNTQESAGPSRVAGVRRLRPKLGIRSRYKKQRKND